MFFQRMFRDHPHSVDETYGEHLLAAGSFGTTMVLAGLACLIHALVPGLFVNFGSAAIERLHERMVVNRHRHRVGAAPLAGSDAADHRR